MTIDLELYKVFYTVGKTGNLTKAAKELYITQPAVSQSIKQLENLLGGRLFVRTPKGMKLTENEGEMMFGYVEKAIDLIRSAENKFRQMKNLAVGVLHIGAGDSLIKYHLMEKINEFHEKHPQIKIQLTNCTTTGAVDLLKTGLIDVAFVNLPVSDPALEIIEIGRVTDCFVTNKKHQALAERVQSLSVLTDHTLMMLDKNSNSRKNVLNFLKENGVNVTPDIELGNLDLLKEFAINGLGIACVVKEYIQKELEEGVLLEIKTDPPLPTRGIGLAVLKDVPASFAVSEFMSSFKKKTV
ncbi:MAG TPA: LysR family transcriptional regulator [Clostridia bacterium]|jgi:LysR family cyn operon transcriptional activator